MSEGYVQSIIYTVNVHVFESSLQIYYIVSIHTSIFSLTLSVSSSLPCFLTRLFSSVSVPVSDRKERFKMAAAHCSIGENICEDREQKKNN